MNAREYGPGAAYYARFVVGVAVVGAVGVWLGASPTIIVIGGLGGAAGASRLRLTMSAEGVAYGRRSATWDELELRETRLSEWLRTKRSVLAGGLRVNLRWFDTHWRSGEIGNDIRRWAPSLLPIDST